jgi:hypothetical protein
MGLTSQPTRIELYEIPQLTCDYCYATFPVMSKIDLVSMRRSAADPTYGQCGYKFDLISPAINTASVAVEAQSSGWKIFQQFGKEVCVCPACQRKDS